MPRDYDTIPITTAVFICLLKVRVNISAAFTLLDVSRDRSLIRDKTSEKKRGKTVGRVACTSYGPATPGTIYRLQYGDLVRGLVLDEEEKTFGFPNGINIKMALEHKGVDLKLSADKIQMSGVKSEADAHAAVQHVLRHLEALDADVQKSQAGDEEALRRLMSHADTPGEIDDFAAWIRGLTEPIIECIEEGSGSPTTVSEESDSGLSDEETETAVDDGPLVRGFVKAMINRNFSIDKLVRLSNFALRMEKVNVFRVLYMNMLHHNVVVAKYDDEEGERGECVKGEMKHTFIVHRSGQVTQSGRDDTRMRAAYYELVSHFE